MVRIGSAPKLSKMPKSGDRHWKDELCYFINYPSILSIYGYYPNVEYRRFPQLVVNYELVQYTHC